MMRSGNYEKDMLLNMVQNIDNYVVDTSPIVNKYLDKYNKTFTD